MAPSGPLHTGGTPAPEMLRQYVERIERLEEEKQALMADIRDVYAEAKAHGLNPKIMRQVVKLRSMDKQDLMELDAELETYRAALDMIEESLMSAAFASRLIDATRAKGTPFVLGLTHI